MHVVRKQMDAHGVDLLIAASSGFHALDKPDAVTHLCGYRSPRGRLSSHSSRRRREVNCLARERRRTSGDSITRCRECSGDRRCRRDAGSLSARIQISNRPHGYCRLRIAALQAWRRAIAGCCRRRYASRFDQYSLRRHARKTTAEINARCTPPQSPKKASIG